uniref:Uncharacterized protein LOC114348819 n=1 Tax=Diabrotica virgifera virgifera TaxID=50390 RepID=A0A6P7HBQ7_DIAVI
MAIENTTFKEAEFIAKNPSYAKITTHNQFEVLSNLNNFPQLPSVANDSTGNFSYVPKPKKSINPPKRKAISPIQCKTSLQFPSSPQSKKPVPLPIIPNPYRDEFMAYKEKLQLQILQEIPFVLERIIKQIDPKLVSSELQNVTQNEIKNILACLSDNDSDGES